MQSAPDRIRQDVVQHYPHTAARCNSQVNGCSHRPVKYPRRVLTNRTYRTPDQIFHRMTPHKKSRQDRGSHRLSVFGLGGYDYTG